MKVVLVLAKQISYETSAYILQPQGFSLSRHRLKTCATNLLLLVRT